MQILSYQPELSPALRVVIGNVDYREFREMLTRIDDLLIHSGTEADFVCARVSAYLAEGEAYANEMGKPLRKIDPQ